MWVFIALAGLVAGFIEYPVMLLTKRGKEEIKPFLLVKHTRKIIIAAIETSAT